MKSIREKEEANAAARTEKVQEEIAIHEKNLAAIHLEYDERMAQSTCPGHCRPAGGRRRSTVMGEHAH